MESFCPALYSKDESILYFRILIKEKVLNSYQRVKKKLRIKWVLRDLIHFKVNLFLGTTILP